MTLATLVGIRYIAGPNHLAPDFDPNWLMKFGDGERVIFPGGKDDAILEVEGYEGPELQSRIVRIVLRRKGSEQPVWSSCQNRLMMPCKPHLVWLADSAHSAGESTDH